MSALLHARRIALLASLAAAVLGLSAGLTGCGIKGALYLPQQKKSRVPETPGNPAPDSSQPAPPESAPSGSTPAPEPAPPAPAPSARG